MRPLPDHDLHEKNERRLASGRRGFCSQDLQLRAAEEFWVGSPQEAVEKFVAAKATENRKTQQTSTIGL